MMDHDDDAMDMGEDMSLFLPLDGGGGGDQIKCESLLSLHQWYMTRLVTGIGSETSIIVELEKLALEWCSKTNMIITGGTAFDFALRDVVGEGFYPNDRAGDVDLSASMEAFPGALSLLDSMIDAHPIFSKFVAGFPPFKHITDRDTESLLHRIRVGPHIVAEINIIEEDIFSTFPTVEVDAQRIFRSRSGGSSEKKEGSFKIRVVPIGASVVNYFRMVEGRFEANLTARIAKNIRYLWKMADLLDKHGLLPKPPTPIEAESERAKRLAAVSEELPLLPDCYYAGSTACDLLFDGCKPDGRKRVIEVICFGKTREVMFAYMEKYDYVSYEIKYHSDWKTNPPAIHLEPAQTSHWPPLIIYDASVMCGYVLGHDSGGNEQQRIGSILTPFSIAGLCGPSQALSMLSFFRHRTSEVQRFMASEKAVGECSTGWFVVKYGFQYHFSRSDFISNRQYVAALQLAYSKKPPMQSRRPRPGDGRTDPTRRRDGEDGRPEK